MTQANVITEPAGKAERLNELRLLLAICKSNLEELEPRWALQEIPEDEDKKAWKRLYAMIAQHQGLAVARAKLISVAKDLVKEIGVIERKEKDPTGKRLDLDRIKGETSIEALTKIIEGQPVDDGEIEF